MKAGSRHAYSTCQLIVLMYQASQTNSYEKGEEPAVSGGPLRHNLVVLYCKHF